MTGRAAITPFILLVVGGGLLIGFLTAPGPWYEALAKPSFNPPNWLFGPVWTVLYVFIAIAGWRIWQRERPGTAMKLWWLQLVLNFLWSPVFFALQQIGLALRRHPRAACRDPRFHRHCLEARPACRLALRSLCGMGRLRLAAQRVHLDPQLNFAALQQY